MDKVKLAVAALLLVGGISAFYWFADQSMLLRVVGLLVFAGISIAVAYQTVIGRQTWGYISDAKTEARKVVWPTRKETLQTTLIVLVVVFIVAVFLWLLDSLLMWLMQLLTGHGG